MTIKWNKKFLFYKKMLVRLYTLSTLPPIYKSEIINGDMCIRNGSEGVPRHWLISHFDGRRAPDEIDYIIVCLKEKKVVGFILGFANAGGDSGREIKNIWYLDTICRKEGNEYRIVSQLMLNRLIIEALKYNVKKITLHATSFQAAAAYKRFGFKNSKHDEKDMYLRL